MANTVWNSADKSAGITLSGGNLTATTTVSVTNCGVRSVNSLGNTGKYYWECTFPVITNFASGVGIGGAAASFTLGGNGTAPVCTTIKSGGGIYIDDTNQGGIGIGSLVNGDVVGIALDLVNRRVFFRKSPSGLWNNNAATDPAGPVNGVAVGFGSGIVPYAMAWLDANGDQIVANFGDSAFVGAVPAGYTSGFPAGVASVNNLVVTQAFIEEWGRGTSVNALMTLASVEMWGSVDTVPSGGVGLSQARAMVMA